MSVLKVAYTTVSIQPDGSHGNLPIGSGIVYSDLPIAKVEKGLQDLLKGAKRFPIVDSIEVIKGMLLSKESADV